MKTRKNNNKKNQKISAKTWVTLIGIWCITGIIAYYILSSILIQPPFKLAEIKGDTIAQIGDIEIGKDELIEKTNELLKQIPDWDEKENEATPEQFTLSSMTNDALFDDFMNRLNIYASNNEVMDAIMGNPAKGIKPLTIINEFKTLYHVESMETYIDMVKNPSKYNIPADVAVVNSLLWKELQDVTLNYIKTQKVANVFARSLQANKIDTKLLYAESEKKHYISLVKKECAFISDNEIKITPEDINNLWKKEQKTFIINKEERRLSYINAIITPSKKDLAQADIVIEKIKQYLSHNETPEIISTLGLTIDTIEIDKKEPANYQYVNFQSIAKPGDVMLLSIMDYEYTIAKYIGNKDNKLTFVEAKYKLAPSENTIADIKNNLSDYAKKFNNNKAFSDSAKAYGYISHTRHISNLSPRIASFYESRNALEWVTKAKVGDVSDVFTIGKDGFLIVAVDGIYTDYSPADDPSIKANIISYLKNEKKAELLISKFDKKCNSIQEYAEYLSAPIENTNTSFDKLSIQGFGSIESNLLGIIPATEKGDLVGPIKCNNSIVYFAVDSIDENNNKFPYDFEGLTHVYFSKTGGALIFSHIPDILIGNSKINIKELLPAVQNK